MNVRRLAMAVLILLLAGVIRSLGATYGLDKVCLLPTAEFWLYDNPQVTSLYATDLRTSAIASPEDETASYPPNRTAVSSPAEALLLRLTAPLLGLLTLALLLRLGRLLRANWWALAGGAVALAPWFVAADRWIERFDFAPLAVALSLCLLIMSYRAKRVMQASPLQTGSARTQLIVAGQILSALALLLIAPPLWWLALLLVYVQPLPKWRYVVFFGLLGLAAVPALQSLYHWAAAARQWDDGTTAALILVGLALALWLRPRLRRATQLVLLAVLLLAGMVSVYEVTSLPRPSPRQWTLVDWLQTRIPNGAILRFYGDSWQVAGVARCPMGAGLDFVTQLDGDHRKTPPDYLVAAGPEEALGEASYVYDIGEDYHVGRMAELPNPVDIPFGERFFFLSYEIVTPQLAPGDLVNLRFDFQLGPDAKADDLRYAAFVHVTLPDQPGEKVVDLNLPLVEEFSVFAPRALLLHQHVRFNLPESIEAGRYDVLFGIYDVYSGERLPTPQADSINIGQLVVE